MKRMLAAGTFSLAAGAVALLLAASIFYSCRSGGDPHHEQSDATLETSPVKHARSVPDTRPAPAPEPLLGQQVLADRR